MKKLIGKINSVILGTLAVLGISTSGHAAINQSIDDSTSQNDSKIIINDINEQSPLYLYHADQIIYDEGELLTWHYSHQSHGSHQSHVSHQSHYSHYSG